MSVRLSTLAPRYQPPSLISGAPDRISFTCPACGLGVVSVWLRVGDADPKHGIHGCNALPPDFETLTVTPSIADEGKCRRCPGWHGHIINGDVTP